MLLNIFSTAVLAIVLLGQGVVSAPGPRQSTSCGQPTDPACADGQHCCITIDIADGPPVRSGLHLIIGDLSYGKSQVDDGGGWAAAFSWPADLPAMWTRTSAPFSRTHVPRTYVHLCGVGRDTAPRSAAGYCPDLLAFFERWERIKIAIDGPVGGEGQALGERNANEQEVNDEFLKPIIMHL
ncbi:hypothetical protein DFH09DRAFT_1369659 [Mycena vulgaris]|nr:hypothetical protein DFH09DRAFT_1369659 [Mycena vulgaris]